jgi:hypothetical protein
MKHTISKVRVAAAAGGDPSGGALPEAARRSRPGYRCAGGTETLSQRSSSSRMFSTIGRSSSAISS